MRIPFVPFVPFRALGVLAIAACSSSSGAAGAGQGSCNLDAGSSPYFTSITLDPSSGASCPTLTPAQLNAAGGDGGEPDGGGGCTTQLASGGCSATITCGPSVTIMATVSGSTFTGTIVITGTTVTCKYDVSGTVH